jgi:hypothetical protein
MILNEFKFSRAQAAAKRLELRRKQSMRMKEEGVQEYDDWLWMKRLATYKTQHVKQQNVLYNTHRAGRTVRTVLPAHWRLGNCKLYCTVNHYMESMYYSLLYKLLPVYTVYTYTAQRSHRHSISTGTDTGTGTAQVAVGSSSSLICSLLYYWLAQAQAN